MQHRKITFIGAGNMAEALISGLIKSGYPKHCIRVCAPSSTRREALANRFQIISSSNNVASATEADVIVLAVKPQIMASVCQQLHEHVDFQSKLVLSIAAGVQISRFYQLLGEKLNIIRVMPNTPSLIGQGMSGLFASPQTNQNDRQYATDLMCCVGKICWLEQESDINSVIAAAGSAPAYFFLFMEAMQNEAQQLGFSPATARLLVQQAATGAAAMVENSPTLSLATLREHVTSKGGTTAEALSVFNQQHLTDIVAQAMQAAVKRAQEMETLF